MKDGHAWCPRCAKAAPIQNPQPGRWPNGTRVVTGSCACGTRVQRIVKRDDA